MTSSNTMTARQRVLAALSHQQPDRVPIDLGSTIVTGISIVADNNIKQHLGSDLPDTRVYDNSASLAIVDEPIMERFGVDTRGVKAGLSDTVRAKQSEADETMLWDEWGFWRKFSSETSTYFLDHAPLSGEITLQSILNYDWPDPDDPGRTRGLREQILSLRQQGEWAIVLSLPTNFILTSFELRGFEDWYIDSKLNQKLLGSLMDQILEIQLATCANILNEVGDLVDIVANFDDLAMQDRIIVSMPDYDQLLEPRLRKLITFIRSATEARIMHHTDGAVEPVLGSLIDMGVDAVNPVQVSAKGMGNIRQLKQKYGDHLAFWGGIDTQSLLPFGSPQEISQSVRETIEILNKEGGYILGSVHNIQNDVPPQNILTMYETALTSNKSN